VAGEEGLQVADDLLGGGFRDQVAFVPGTKRSTCPLHEALPRWFSPLRLPTLGQTFDLVPLHEALSRWFSPLRSGCPPWAKHSTWSLCTKRYRAGFPISAAPY
jgi:hypothetical protein